jgi:hypothetical protein
MGGGIVNFKKVISSHLFQEWQKNRKKRGLFFTTIIGVPRIPHLFPYQLTVLKTLNRKFQ